MITTAKLSHVLCLAFAASTPFALADELEVGADSPEVAAVDQDGEAVDFGEILAEGLTFVYFYPKALTPGCTRQACNLRDHRDELVEAGVGVYGVSTDPGELLNEFIAEKELNFTLVSDLEGEVCEAFGVPRRGGQGFASRWSFLFKDGKLVWKDTAPDVDTQAEAVLAAVAELDEE